MKTTVHTMTKHINIRQYDGELMVVCIENVGLPGLGIFHKIFIATESDYQKKSLGRIIKTYF